MIRCAAELVSCVFSWVGFRLDATNLVPGDGTTHGGHKHVHNLSLIRQGETQRILGKGGCLFGHVPYESARVGVILATDCWVGERDNGERYIIIYVGDEREVLETRFDKFCLVGHDDGLNV